MKTETVSKTDIAAKADTTKTSALQVDGKPTMQDYIPTAGQEQVGADHVAIAQQAHDDIKQKEQERIDDKRLDELDKKIKDPTEKTKINDSAEIKQLSEDGETVRAMLALPADERTPEFGTVIGFYYKRMNETVKKIHDKLAGTVSEADKADAKKKVK